MLTKLVAQINSFIKKNTKKIHLSLGLILLILLSTACSSPKKTIIKKNNNLSKHKLNKNLKKAKTKSEKNKIKDDKKNKKNFNLKLDINNDGNARVKDLVYKTINKLSKTKYYASNILVLGSISFKALNKKFYVQGSLKLKIKNSKTNELYQKIVIIKAENSWTFKSSKELVEKKILIKLEKELTKSFENALIN